MLDIARSDAGSNYYLVVIVHYLYAVSQTKQNIILIIIIAGFALFAYQLFVLPRLETDKLKKAEIELAVQKAATDSIEQRMHAEDSLHRQEIEVLTQQRDSLLVASTASTQMARAINAAIRKSINENEQKTSRVISLPAPQFSREMSKFPVDSGR